MIIRLALGGAIVAGIFLASPVRQGDRLASMITGATETVARQGASHMAPLVAASARVVAEPAVRTALDTFLGAGTAEAISREAPAAPTGSVAIDTLRPADRRVRWRGPTNG